MSEASVVEIVRQAEGIPRQNGELVFGAPWEARAFGIAIALVSGNVIEWADFRQELIAEIAAWESENGESGPGWSYYARWLTALERVLLARGVVLGTELDTREQAIAEAAAHEHDGEHHAHDHDHAHDD